MSVFLESPWPAIAVGLLVGILLAVAYINTRHPRLRLAMLATVVGVILMLLIERLIVTEREAVAQTLEDVALALESNELENVLAFLAPEGERIRTDAQRYLPVMQIGDAHVGGDLDVKVNRLTNPPTARATFTGRITGVNRNPAEQSPYDNFVRRFTLLLRQDGQRWLITDYEMGNLR